MLQNAYLLAKVGADIAENEQHFAGILPIGHRVADRAGLPGARPALVIPPPPEARFRGASCGGGSTINVDS